MNEIKNAKQQQIVTTARTLFWKFGIKRVSIGEICREANVSKMTFYKHFTNKIELAKYIIDQMMDEVIVKYREIMELDIPFIEKVIKTIHLKMEYTDNLSQEFYGDILKNTEPELTEYLNIKRQHNLQTIINDYIEAQKQGDVRADIKPQFIIYFLNHLVEMCNDEKLLQLYDSPQDLIMELTNFFFFGILNRKTEK